MVEYDVFAPPKRHSKEKRLSIISTGKTQKYLYQLQEHEELFEIKHEHWDFLQDEFAGFSDTYEMVEP